ncbi:MAG: hypothetical protein AAF192_15515 [Pseudomonadota bacterium]
MDGIVVLGSITDAAPAHRGLAAICGSHGGLNAAAMASSAGLRAVILSDAGRGLDGAGVAGVLALAQIGMAAAAVDAGSARIGDGADIAARGRISVANAAAAALGVAPGMAAHAAAERLRAAPLPQGVLTAPPEARRTVRVGALTVLLVDSASQITAQDAGGVVLTGSHGGLVGGDPKRALKAPMRLGVFNDAGIGADDAGVARLGALERAGQAGATVSHDSARIGDAASMLSGGVISRANGPAREMGLREGLALREVLAALP